jgi:hypothetical protein
MLGLIGYPVFLVGTVLAMFNLIHVTHGAGMLALVPGGLFELILPIWLVAKGFASPRITDDPRLKPVPRAGHCGARVMAVCCRIVRSSPSTRVTSERARVGGWPVKGRRLVLRGAICAARGPRRTIEWLHVGPRRSRSCDVPR